MVEREKDDQGRLLYDSHEIRHPSLQKQLEDGEIAIRAVKLPHKTESNRPDVTGGGRIIPAHIVKGSKVIVKGGNGANDSTGVILSVGEQIALVQDDSDPKSQIWRAWNILEAASTADEAK